MHCGCREGGRADEVSDTFFLILTTAAFALNIFVIAWSFRRPAALNCPLPKLLDEPVPQA